MWYSRKLPLAIPAPCITVMDWGPAVSFSTQQRRMTQEFGPSMYLILFKRERKKLNFHPLISLQIHTAALGFGQNKARSQSLL